MHKSIEKIKNRKNTTTIGLESLNIIISGLNLYLKQDIENVESNIFNGLYVDDNGVSTADFNYKEWENNEFYWEIQQGSIKLITVDSRNSQYFDIQNKPVFNILNLKQIDFEQAYNNLELLIYRYAEKSINKDKQINDFLHFCDDWNKSIK